MTPLFPLQRPGPRKAGRRGAAVPTPTPPRQTEKLASSGALSLFAEPPLQPAAAPGAAPSPAAPQPAMAMVNMNSLLNGKDSRWLQLEVCREFQRNKCSRPDTECKFAHPPANVEVQNGRVTACYDSIKVSALREKCSCRQKKKGKTCV
ncbi:hypothetical protein ONE63_004215 [Megalurothrips usitatus]|uniref:C3H1-type domain-containing protein n=1 Tax=Megalurothrips usitatus TaxID=439358 RepID=A0AAV7X6G7_9NEOP|nr:hypothetical protein ONE63_004215 [Megalurothrips usitatus]